MSIRERRDECSNIRDEYGREHRDEHSGIEMSMVENIEMNVVA